MLPLAEIDALSATEIAETLYLPVGTCVTEGQCAHLVFARDRVKVPVRRLHDTVIGFVALTHTERHEPALERLLGTTGRFDERPAAHVTREHERRRRAYRWLRRLLAHSAATHQRKRKGIKSED